MHEARHSNRNQTRAYKFTTQQPRVTEPEAEPKKIYKRQLQLSWNQKPCQSQANAHYNN